MADHIRHALIEPTRSSVSPSGHEDLQALMAACTPSWPAARQYDEGYKPMQHGPSGVSSADLHSWDGAS